MKYTYYLLLLPNSTSILAIKWRRRVLRNIVEVSEALFYNTVDRFMLPNNPVAEPVNITVECSP